jgi:hypothetical protein
MRYWAYLAAKLVVAGACLYGLLLLIGSAWPGPPVPPRTPKAQAAARPADVDHPLSWHVRVPEARINVPDDALVSTDSPAFSKQDPGASAKGPSDLRPLNDGLSRLWFNLAMMGWFLVAAGTLYVIIWDQRYRCRTCLRRLRMPIETGSWGRMLLHGRPRIEYICPYGHGTLKEDELQISGLANPEWTPQSEDIWEELCASIQKDSDKRQ